MSASELRSTLKNRLGDALGNMTSAKRMVTRIEASTKPLSVTDINELNNAANMLAQAAQDLNQISGFLYYVRYYKETK